MDGKLVEGEKLFTEGRLGEAALCFENVLKDDPANGRALNNLGVIAFKQSDGNRAADLFLKSIKADPSYTDPVANLCALLRASGNLHEALPVLETLIEKYPGNEEILSLFREAGGKQDRLTGKRLAIVNALGNKFDSIYRNHFSGQNEVVVVKPQTEQELRDILAWADIVWSTWCNEPVVRLSNLDPKVPLVTHIRSYEVLTPPFMQQTNWQKISGAIFVADHIREIANEMWPSQLAGVTQTTVNNMVRLETYPFYDKTPGKNIAYIGYLNHKKGIPLLLQCLQRAVAVDSEFRLHVAGAFQEPRFEVYWNHLVAQLKLGDHVVMHGWVRDVPDFLSNMDFVISTSPWEGCPNNVIEAMACGVKPIVHNWRGAEQLFPSELVFTTIDECIEILTDENYSSHNYRDWVWERFNAARNLQRIDSFLYQTAAESPSRGHVPGRSAEFTEPAKPRPALSLVDPPAVESPAVDPPVVDGLNFYQPLPKSMEVATNRKSVTIEFCKGKRVLHVGCVDAGMMDTRIKDKSFLHFGIDKVASRLIGVDVDEKGLARLHDEGFEVYQLDLQTDRNLLARLSADVDVIVIPEVLEHLSNVGKALDNLKACRFKGEIIITTPNAFSYRAQQVLASGTELVHPDHNYFFSPTTLKTLLSKHGLEIERLLMYYWPLGDEIGQRMEQIIRRCPYVAEGLIAVVRDPDARSASAES
jgi:glycosyltransferase involved in cell wall biosynthesis/2-polyprenyl-3-methyl-5-hydroxy-6-metoxy-1,4-benzoquinol methylase